VREILHPRLHPSGPGFQDREFAPGHIFCAGQAGNVLDETEKLGQGVSVAQIIRNFSMAKGTKGAFTLPLMGHGQDQVGFQGQDGLQVELPVGTDAGFLFYFRGIVAKRGDPYHPVPYFQEIQDFGEAGGQGNQAPGGAEDKTCRPWPSGLALVSGTSQVRSTRTVRTPWIRIRTNRPGRVDCRNIPVVLRSGNNKLLGLLIS
jgi:hypothetical protein